MHATQALPSPAEACPVLPSSLRLRHSSFPDLQRSSLATLPGDSQFPPSLMLAVTRGAPCDLLLREPPLLCTLRAAPTPPRRKPALCLLQPRRPRSEAHLSIFTAIPGPQRGSKQLCGINKLSTGFLEDSLPGRPSQVTSHLCSRELKADTKLESANRLKSTV